MVISVQGRRRRSWADFCVQSACPCLCACPLGAPVSPTEQQSCNGSNAEKKFNCTSQGICDQEVFSSSSSLSIMSDTQDRAQQHWQDIKSHIQVMTNPSMIKIDSVQFIQFFRLTDIDCLCISIHFTPPSVLLRTWHYSLV